MSYWLEAFLESCLIVAGLSAAVILGVVCAENAGWITDGQARTVSGVAGLIGVSCGASIVISVWWETRT